MRLLTKSDKLVDIQEAQLDFAFILVKEGRGKDDKMI